MASGQWHNNRVYVPANGLWRTPINTGFRNGELVAMPQAQTVKNLTSAINRRQNSSLRSSVSISSTLASTTLLTGPTPFGEEAVNTSRLSGGGVYGAFAIGVGGVPNSAA